MTCFLTLAALFAGTQGGGETLTLDDALRLADHNAFAILLQQAAVEKQRQAVNQNIGTLGPSAILKGTYTRFDQQATAQFQPNTPPVIISPLDTKVATATVSVPVDISGNTRRLIAASKASLLAQKDTLDARRNDTSQTIRTDYLAVLRAQSQVSVAEEAINSETENLRTTQLQFDKGTVAKIDVLTAQTQLSTSKSDLITAQNTLTLAKESLNNALARKIQTPLKVVDPVNLPDPILDEDFLTKRAQQQRPEAVALIHTRDALAKITRATEQGNNPSLNLSVTYTQNIQPQGLGTRNNTTTGVAELDFPVYDSGQTRARVKEARQDEVTAKVQYDQILLSISLEVRQAIANLTNARAKLAVANDQIASAREALRLAKLKQQQGEGIYLEVLNAQQSLTQAEQAQLTAKYDYLQAVTDLQHAYGTKPLPEVIK